MVHRVKHIPAALAILTVSDTRTEEEDGSGALIRQLLEEAGHSVFDYRIVPDEPDKVVNAVLHWLGQTGCHGVMINGGTGISARDRTPDALLTIMDRRLHGFGELFRVLSYEQVGSAAMMSRAVAGIARGRLLFCMPGSTGAVRLAMEKLILPEISHLIDELS